MSLSIYTGLLTRLPISSSPICLIGRATFFIDVKGIIRGVCTKNIDFRRVALLFRFRPFVLDVDAGLTSELIFALLSFVLLLGRHRTIYCNLQLQCAYQVRGGDADLGRKGGQVGCTMESLKRGWASGRRRLVGSLD